MGLLNWACKNVGLTMMAASSGHPSKYLNRQNMGSSPELAKMSNELCSLIEDTARAWGEWKDILKEVNDKAFDVLCDTQMRNVLLVEADGCTPLAVNDLCDAILGSEPIKNLAELCHIDILDMRLAMVMIPRSMVDKTLALLAEIGVTGAQLQKVRDEIAHLVLSPRGAVSIYSKCSSVEIESRTLTAAFFVLERQEIVPLWIEAGINVKDFYTKISVLKQKYGIV